MRTLPSAYRVVLLLTATSLCIGAGSQRKAQSASAVLASYSPEVVQLLHEKKLAPLPGTQGSGLYIGALVIFDQLIGRINCVFGNVR